MRPIRTMLACLCALSLSACKSDDADAADGGSSITHMPTAGASGTTAGTGGPTAGNGSSTGDAATGNAGNTADASSDLDDAGTAPCQPCIGNTLTWGPNGGFVAYTDQSTLTSCNVYRHVRSPSRADPSQTMLACERQLPCMGSGLHGIADVLQALEDPDVVAARAKGNVLYGVDSRPVDGTVLRIELSGSVIEVGYECGDGGGCVAIPSGIATLVSLLESVNMEQLGIEPCFSTFN